MRTAATAPAAVTGGETMAAMVQDRYGTAPEAVLRMEPVTEPVARDDEVLVRVGPRAWTGARGT